MSFTAPDANEGEGEGLDVCQMLLEMQTHLAAVEFDRDALQRPNVLLMQQVQQLQ